MTDANLSAAAVRELVRTGEARPMLAGTEVGPTWYDGRWWYVPADAEEGADYQPAGPELAARFDKLRARAQAVEEVQAELDDRR
ncbi:hypothetical protein [Kribbella sp. NPDC004875]|uniref:hypothetical protein n=1 Tax=Kribbella sp. NPDC004875 TaxID=3364107 RepID=UPI00369A5125